VYNFNLKQHASMQLAAMSMCSMVECLIFGIFVALLHQLVTRHHAVFWTKVRIFSFTFELHNWL